MTRRSFPDRKNHCTRLEFATIPAEGLAATLALFPFFQSELWARWLIVAVSFAVFVPGWVWITYVRAAQDDAAKGDFPAKAVLLGMFAYAVWVGTLPDSPYLAWPPWSTEIGVAVTVGAGVLFVFLDAIGDTIGTYMRARKRMAPDGSTRSGPQVEPNLEKDGAQTPGE